MDNRLQNITDELREIKNDSKNIESEGGGLGYLIKISIIILLILIAIIVCFFPRAKVEYTIGNKKSIFCYNPISKICITMELEKTTTTDDGEVGYYTIVTKGSGHVNVFYEIKNEKTLKVFYMNYGLLSSTSFIDDETDKNRTDEISIFNVVKNYMFGNLGDKIFLESTE